MATAQKSGAQAETTLTTEAYELLDCFTMELAEIVFEIAAAEARKESAVGHAEPRRPVDVSIDHIRMAAEAVIAVLSKSAAAGDLPEHMAAEIGLISQCIDAKK